jgi:hypothetical protein
MSVCKRCANIDFDDASVRNTYLLGHVRVMMASAKAGCPGCKFFVKAARRRGIDVWGKRDELVLLRRLGDGRVDAHFVGVQGRDEGSGDEEEEEEEESSDEEEDDGEDTNGGEGSVEQNEEGSCDDDSETSGTKEEDSDDDESEDEDVSTVHLKLCSIFGKNVTNLPV